MKIFFFSYLKHKNVINTKFGISINSSDVNTKGSVCDDQTEYCHTEIIKLYKLVKLPWSLDFECEILIETDLSSITVHQACPRYYTIYMLQNQELGKIFTGQTYKLLLNFTVISDVYKSFIPNKTTFTKCCLSLSYCQSSQQLWNPWSKAGFGKFNVSGWHSKLGLGRVPRAPEYSPGQTITRVANQHPGTPYRTGFPVLTLHTSAALLLMASVIPFHRYQPRSDQFITAKVKTGQSTSQLCEPPGPYKAKCLWTAPGWPVTGCAGPSHHGTGTEIRYQDPSALPWSKMATATTGKDVYTAISTLSHCVSRVWRWV